MNSLKSALASEAYAASARAQWEAYKASGISQPRPRTMAGAMMEGLEQGRALAERVSNARRQRLSIHCGSCGAPPEPAAHAACSYCGAPAS